MGGLVRSKPSAPPPPPTPKAEAAPAPKPDAAVAAPEVAPASPEPSAGLGGSGAKMTRATTMLAPRRRRMEDPTIGTTTLLGR